MAVTGFGSWEEMLEAQAEAEAAANARVTSEQAGIGWGEYFARYHEEYDLWIFGEIYSEEKADRLNREAGASNRAAEEEAAELRSAHARGYRYGVAYSLATPRGDIGSTHISEIGMRLSRQEFELMREMDWSMEALLAEEAARFEEMPGDWDAERRRAAKANSLGNRLVQQLYVRSGRTL